MKYKEKQIDSSIVGESKAYGEQELPGGGLQVKRVRKIPETSLRHLRLHNAFFFLHKPKKKCSRGANAPDR